MFLKTISGLLHRCLGKGSADLVTQKLDVMVRIGDPSASVFSPGAIGYRSSLRRAKVFSECSSVFLFFPPQHPLGA